MRWGRFLVILIVVLVALVVVYDLIGGSGDGDDARPVLDPTLLDTPTPSPPPTERPTPTPIPVKWDWVTDFDRGILVDMGDATADQNDCGQRDNPCNTIQAAMANAFGGATINVESGLYTETVVIPEAFNVTNLSIVGNPRQRPIITGGLVFQNRQPLNRLRVARLVWRGAAPGARAIVSFDNAGRVTNLTLNNNVFDGEFRQGLHGVRGGNLAGNLTVTNNEFKNVLGWSVLDTHANSDVLLTFTTIIFSSNTVHDSNGTVALRGNPNGKTDRVEVTGNAWEGIGGNSGARGEQWAALEVSQAQLAIVENNVVNQRTEGLFGFGQPFQIAGVDNLKFAENEINLVMP